MMQAWHHAPVARLSCLIALGSTGFCVVARRVLRDKEDRTGSAVISNDTGGCQQCKQGINGHLLIVARSTGCHVFTGRVPEEGENELGFVAVSDDGGACDKDASRALRAGCWARISC